MPEIGAFGGSEEQPVLLANRRGPDGVLGQVAVDLNFAMVQEPRDGFPLVQGIPDRLASLAVSEELPWSVLAPRTQTSNLGFGTSDLGPMSTVGIPPMGQSNP